MPKGLSNVVKRLRSPLDRRDARRRIREFHSQPRKIAEITDVAMNFRGKGYFKIRTKQIPSEITALAEVVAQIRPSVIVEIGTARCGTLFIWSHLASTKVISCDRRSPKRLTSLIPDFSPPNSTCRIELLIGNTHDTSFAAQLRDCLEGSPVDFLFLDGDHTETGVEADFLSFAPLVRPGGLIAFHDIVESQPKPTNQVHAFWRRLSPVAEHRTFIADSTQCGYGIGVITVSDPPSLMIQKLTSNSPTNA